MLRTHGASSLGQLSGLEDDKEKYAESVSVLCDGDKTRLVLVSRPDIIPMTAAERTSQGLLLLLYLEHSLLLCSQQLWVFSPKFLSC